MKACLRCPGGAQRDGGGEAQVKPCPGYSQAHHRSPQPIRHPPETHLHKPWGARGQLGIKIKDPEEWTPCPGSRGGPRPRSPGVTPIPMSHGGQLHSSPFGLRAVAAQSCGKCYGMQGKSILGLHTNYDGTFRGGTKSGTREAFRWFGKEGAWENGGMGVSQRWLVRANRDPLVCRHSGPGARLGCQPRLRALPENSRRREHRFLPAPAAHAPSQVWPRCSHESLLWRLVD